MEELFIYTGMVVGSSPILSNFGCMAEWKSGDLLHLCAYGAYMGSIPIASVSIIEFTEYSLIGKIVALGVIVVGSSPIILKNYI